MANEVMGARSYLNLISESTWGTKPGSPTRVFMPVNDYGVQLQTETRQGKPFVGTYSRKHSQRRKSMPTGSIATNLFGYHSGGISLAEYMLDWSMVDESGTIHEARDLPSKTAEWAEGPDVSNVEHNGLRVNQSTLTGDESSGVLALNLDVMGKTEVTLGSAAAVPDDLEDLTEFEFEDLVFRIDDGAGGSLAAIAISSFQLQVQQALDVRFNNSLTPTGIYKGDRLVTLAITIDKNSDDYDVVRRTLSSETDYVCQVLLQGLNNGSATDPADIWTIGTLDINKARYVDHRDNRNRDTIFQQPLQFICLKPDSSSEDIEIAWTEATSKT